MSFNLISNYILCDHEKEVLLLIFIKFPKYMKYSSTKIGFSLIAYHKIQNKTLKLKCTPSTS